MDGICDKRKRIKEAIRHFLNFFFYPFPLGDLVIEIVKYIEHKVKEFFSS
jgi:hypothetical protein